MSIYKIIRNYGENFALRSISWNNNDRTLMVFIILRFSEVIIKRRNTGHEAVNVVLDL